jgi:hypothetical protein
MLCSAFFHLKAISVIICCIRNKEQHQHSTSEGCLAQADEKKKIFVICYFLFSLCHSAVPPCIPAFGFGGSGGGKEKGNSKEGKRKNRNWV